MKVYPFSRQSLKFIPPLSGVYLFRGSGGEVLYVGKAKNLQKRLESYFSSSLSASLKLSFLQKMAKTLEFTLVESEFDALLLEAKLIKKNQPKLNVLWKDDKHYLYIKITQEEFPRVLLARKKERGKGTFFGPFPSAKIVRQVLSFLRRIFPFCQQSPTRKKPCFYTQLGLCSPCPGEIRQLEGLTFQKKKAEYLQSISRLRAVLSGKSSKIKKILAKKMREEAAKENFEEGQKIKEQLENLELLVAKRYSPDFYLADPEFLEKKYQKETEMLFFYLKNYFPKLLKIEKIECYDISNFAGKQAAGSLVTFLHGFPEKSLYRHFRLKSKRRDDFSLLQEILSRRLKKKSKCPLPDLLMVDGGKPQILAFQKVLEKQKVDLPVIGLAKKREEIVVPWQNSFQKIRLPADSPARLLVERIRNEAHRFAHQYYRLLARKYLFQSLKRE